MSGPSCRLGDSRDGGPYLLKLACTDVLPVMVRVQLCDVPEQAPPQLTKAFPTGGTAVSVTTVPELYFAEQELPDRKSTRLNSSHSQQSRMPSSA